MTKKIILKVLKCQILLSYSFFFILAFSLFFDLGNKDINEGRVIIAKLFGWVFTIIVGVVPFISLTLSAYILLSIKFKNLTVIDKIAIVLSLVYFLLIALYLYIGLQIDYG